MKTIKEIMEAAKKVTPKRISIAVAQDFEILSAVSQAKKLNIADAILVGDKDKIEKIAKDNSISIDGFEIIDIKDDIEASKKAVEIVSKGKADIVMKGMLETSVYMKAVLDPMIGLKTGNILSCVGMAEIDGFDKFIFYSDPVMNPMPDLNTKREILLNAVKVAHAVGIEEPKVAVISAKENVDSKLPSTIDARELEEMNKRGEITGCIVAGPVSLDIAISRKSAEHKKYNNPVGGNADILLLPNLEVANVFYKSLIYFAKAKTAGIVTGAKAPIIITSRADSDTKKLASIALCVLMAEQYKL